MIFKVENLDEVKEYQIAEKDFDNDYDKDNPATRAEALEKGKNIQILKRINPFFWQNWKITRLN